MKVIDLLNKIANGERPNFMYRNNKYIYDKFDNSYKPSFLGMFKIYAILNDEVEIIEPQEHRIPKKINDILRVNDLIPPVDENMYKIWEQTIKNHNKINEILDYFEEIE